MRPRGFWSALGAGAATGIVAGLVAFTVALGPAVIMANSVVAQLEDLALLQDSFPTKAAAEEARLHPQDRLLQKYPDLEALPEAERAQALQRKMVADQVVGIFAGIVLGMVMAVAVHLPLSISGAVVAMYLLQRRRDWPDVLVPYYYLSRYGATLLVPPVQYLGFAEWTPLSSALAGVVFLSVFLVALWRDWDWRLYPPIDFGLLTVWWLIVAPLATGQFNGREFVVSAVMAAYLFYMYRRQWEWRWYVMLLPVFVMLNLDIMNKLLPIYLGGLLFLWHRSRPTENAGTTATRRSLAPILKGADIVVALLIGAVIGAAYMEEHARSTQTARVLFARQALEGGTVLKDPLSLFEAREATGAHTSLNGVHEGDARIVTNRILNRRLEAGQLLGYFTLVRDDRLAARLPPGKRALAVKVSAATDNILPGVHVDVIHCVKRGAKAESRFILGKLLVQDVDVPRNTPVLEVTPEQAVFLACAKESGSIHLVLRGADVPDGDLTLPVLPRLSAPPKLDAEPGPVIDRDLPDRLKSALDRLMKPGMQTFTLKVGADSGVAGFVLPDSRVDVIYSWRAADDNHACTLLLQNVVVRAIDLLTEGHETSGHAPSTTITLEVTPQQAALLAAAKKRGAFQLALRPAGDDSVAPVGGQ